MEIRYRDIVLRDMTERDIEDDIRWNTVETAWADWDAPWEMAEELEGFDPEAYRREQLECLKRPKEDFRWSFELDTSQGVHIGSVNAYLIDAGYQWVASADVKAGQKVYRTLGIDISDSRYWGRGLGKQALCAFIRYHFDHGYTALCLQTWSGNIRMVRAAERLGFALCHKRAGVRQVRGEAYDGLTFRLDCQAFQRYLLETEK